LVVTEAEVVAVLWSVKDSRPRELQHCCNITDGLERENRSNQLKKRQMNDRLVVNGKGKKV
jgi:hypothetical protein